LIDFNDRAVDHASLEDDGLFAQRQSEFVEQAEIQGKASFDLYAVATDLLNRDWLDGCDSP
jgi:hypothetical protein